MFNLFSKKAPDSVAEHKDKISALQQRQRELTAKRLALKEEARDVQAALDAANEDFAKLRKQVARETGLKIAPVGVGSGEQFGQF